MVDFPFVVVTCLDCRDCRLAMPEEAATTRCKECGGGSRMWKQGNRTNYVKHLDDRDPFDVNSFASTIFPRIPRPTFLTVDLGDHELYITSDMADKMVPGKEYSVKNGTYAVRRDGLRLHARKLEQYDRLIDLE